MLQPFDILGAVGRIVGMGHRTHRAQAPVQMSTVTLMVLLLCCSVLEVLHAAVPTIDQASNATITENSGVQSIGLTGLSDGGSSAGSLTVSAVSSNHMVLLDPTAVYSYPAATATLLLAPVADQSGTASVTVTVIATGGALGSSTISNTMVFTITVSFVNQPPTINVIPAQAVAEDSAGIAITLTGLSVGPVTQTGQTIAISAVSFQQSLLATPVITYTSPASTASMSLVPIAHQSGVATVQVTVMNSGGTAHGGVNTTTEVFQVSVTHTPQTPFIVVNAPLSLAIHSTGVIDGNVLDVSDYGLPSQIIFTVASLPSLGVLKYSGSVVSAGSTFTQADVNAGLVTYSNLSLTAGNDSFTFTAINSDSRSVPLTTFQINISGINSAGAPVVSLPGTGVTWVQAAGAVTVDPEATLSAGQLIGGAMSATLVANGTSGDVLAITNVGTGDGQIGVSGTVVTFAGATIGIISGGNGGTPLTVSLLGSATVPAVQALIDSLSFNNTDVAPSATTRQVQVVISDSQGDASTPVSADVLIQTVDQPPVVTLPALTVAYSTLSGVQQLDGNATVQHPGSPFLGGGTLTASWAANGNASDQLSILASGGAPGVSVNGSTLSYLGSVVGTFSGGANGTALVASFNSMATPAAAQAILQSLAYSNPLPNPSTALRLLSVVVDDGQGASSVPAEMTVVIEQVDDPPVLSLPSGGLTYLQNAGVVVIDPLTTTTDATNSSFPSGVLEVQFTIGATADDQLVVTSQGNGAGQIGVSGTTVSYGGTAIGVVTGPGSQTSPLLVLLNGNATIAATQALARQISMLNAASRPIVGPRTVQYVLTDGQGGISLPVTTVVTVQDVDLPPVVTLPSVPATWEEGSAPIAIDAAATIVDTDSSSLVGGFLSVTLSDGQTGDMLGIATQGVSAGQVGISGSTVLVGGVAIGTFSGGSGTTPLLISLTSQSTPTNVEAVLQAVVFSHVGVFTSNQVRNVQVIANDGELSGTPATTTLLVDWVRSTPVANTLTLSTLEGVAVTGTLSGSDVESFPLTFAISSQPSKGSAALLDAVAGTISYTPNPGTIGADSFTVTVSDGILTSIPVTVNVVVISRLDTVRPQVVSSPPREGFLTQPITYLLQADISQLPAGTDLQFQVVGSPTGVTLLKTGATTATITWTATGTPEVHQEIDILVTDPVGGSAAYQPVQVLWHAFGGGSS
jgi:hypothetical protein